MTLDELKKRFEQPGVILDEQPVGLVRVNVETAVASGQMYLHGAHCTGWQPVGHQPVLWMSQHSYYQPDKPIRGGVPICFPWFGPHASDQSQPAHGKARLKSWKLRSILRDANGTISLKCATRIEPFDLEYMVSFGTKLTLSLTTQLPVIIRARSDTRMLCTPTSASAAFTRSRSVVSKGLATLIKSTARSNQTSHPDLDQVQRRNGSSLFEHCGNVCLARSWLVTAHRGQQVWFTFDDYLESMDR